MGSLLESDERVGITQYKATLNNGLDIYYTPPDVAKACYQSMRDVCDELGLVIMQWVEPAAGTGNFFNCLPQNKRVGMDLLPDCDGVIKDDFITTPYKFNHGAAVISNPPFGKNSSSAIAFFHKAAKFASVIGFVLPVGWRHDKSLHRKMPNGWRLIKHDDLGIVNFYDPNKRPMNIPTCFQVWACPDIKCTDIRAKQAEEDKAAGLVMIRDVCRLVDDKPKYFTGKKPYYDTKSVTGVFGATCNPQMITYKQTPRANLLPPINSVGFAKMKGTNKTIIVDRIMAGSIFSTGFQFLECGDDILPEYLLAVVSSDKFQQQKDEYCGGMIMPSITKRAAGELKIQLPPIEEQQAFTKELSAARQQCEEMKTRYYNARMNFLQLLQEKTK